MNISDLKHGTRVTCEIEGEKIDDARISINSNGWVFLCQNKVKQDYPDADKLGYDYAWFTRCHRDELASSNGCISDDSKILSILPEPKTLDNLEVGDILVLPFEQFARILAVCGEAVLLSYPSEDVESDDLKRSDGDWHTLFELKEDGCAVHQPDQPAEKQEGGPTMLEQIRDIAEKAEKLRKMVEK